MSIRKQSLLSNCIVLFIFGLLLIPAVSATNNIFSSSTGYLILHNGSMEPKIISPDAILSHYTYSGSASEIWGGFQGPSPFNKIQGFCTSFNIPDNQTSPANSNTTQQNSTNTNPPPSNPQTDTSNLLPKQNWGIFGFGSRTIDSLAGQWLSKFWAPPSGYAETSTACGNCGNSFIKPYQNLY